MYDGRLGPILFLFIHIECLAFFFFFLNIRFLFANESLNDRSGNAFCMSRTDASNQFLAAAKNGDLAKLQEWVKNGVDVNCTDNKKFTALHKACSEGHQECVTYLIGKGADVNALAQGGITPLHLATEGAHANIVEEIIGKVSNVNQCTSPTLGSDTPLHWLVKNPPKGRNKVEEMKQILGTLYDNGANLDIVNDDKDTILHLACVNEGFKEIVEQLLKLGANWDVIDKDSTTPYKLAVLHHGRHAPISKLLESVESRTDGSRNSQAPQMDNIQTDGGPDVPKTSQGSKECVITPDSKEHPVYIFNPECVVLGDHATINQQTKFAAHARTCEVPIESEDDVKN